MIFIPTEHLRAGMVLANDIDIGVGTLPLLSRGQMLTDGFIKRIRDLNVSGIYVESKLFDDIVVRDVVDKELKRNVLTNVKRIFEDFSRSTLITDNALKTIEDLSRQLVENILFNDEILINLSDLKGYDDYTYCHSLSVAVLGITIGLRLGYSQQVLSELAASALLHDIGKMKIDVTLLNKPGPLSEEEFAIIKEHPRTACEQLEKRKIFPMSVLSGVESHHEKFDGTGYPKRLKGRIIPLYGRILAVADVYDALTSNRPYRKACFPGEAVEYMMANSEIHFDYEILDAFLKSVAAYPAGTFVILSDGQTALVVKSLPENTLRPVVRILRKDGTCSEDIDLLHDCNYMNITIVGRGCDDSIYDLSVGVT